MNWCRRDERKEQHVIRCDATMRGIEEMCAVRNATRCDAGRDQDTTRRSAQKRCPQRLPQRRIKRSKELISRLLQTPTDLRACCRRQQICAPAADAKTPYDCAAGPPLAARRRRSQPVTRPAALSKADIASSPSAPDGRNAAIAALIKNLIDASDDETAKQSLLDDATTLLLEPFVGIPEEGSVFEGCDTEEEKAAKYRGTIALRAAKARASANGEATAVALETMRDHVLLKLRGGGKPSQADKDWDSKVDKALDKAEEGINKLRDALKTKSVQAPTAGDAAFAGFVTGFACGTVLIGDAVYLGVGLGAGCAAVQKWPEKVSPKVAKIVARGGSVVSRARARL